MISLLSSSPLAFLLTAVGLIIALTIHEFSHALVADKLGDPTARVNGRLTLNPLAHLDPMGTLLLFVFGFGWGKPVPIDPYNLPNPRKNMALVSLAGPASNIILATIFSLLARLFITSPFALVLYPLIVINITLAVFNFIPIHPLDGQKILSGLLPTDLAYEYELIMQRYGTFILIFMVLPVFGTSPVYSIVHPIVTALSRFLLP